MAKKKEEVAVVNPQAIALIKRAQEIQFPIKEYKITTVKQLFEGADLVKKAKQYAKDAEDALDSIIQPSKVAIKAAQKIFKPLIEKGEIAETVIKNAIVQFDNMEKAEAKKNGIEFVPEYIEGISRSSKIKYNIVDEEKVPHIFYSEVIDPKKIQGAILQDPNTKIPGVEIYEDTIVSVRLNKEEE